MDLDELAAEVAAERAAQGLPPKIEDPATVERVMAIFRQVNPDRLAHARRDFAEQGDDTDRAVLAGISDAAIDQSVREYLADNPGICERVERGWAQRETR